MAAAKKAEKALEDVALIAGTQQNLSNLFLSFSLYDIGASVNILNFVMFIIVALV